MLGPNSQCRLLAPSKMQSLPVTIAKAKAAQAAAALAQAELKAAQTAAALAQAEVELALASQDSQGGQLSGAQTPDLNPRDRECWTESLGEECGLSEQHRKSP